MTDLDLFIITFLNSKIIKEDNKISIDYIIINPNYTIVINYLKSNNQYQGDLILRDEGIFKGHFTFNCKNINELLHTINKYF